MVLFEWSDELSVGIEVIDEQHRRLVGIINDLHAAMLRREGPEALAEIFGRLVAYTRQHFAYEEEFLDRHGYPETEAHRAQHVLLTQNVRELEAAFLEGKPNITVEVMEFLRDWLRHHIAVSDRRYATYLQKQGAC